MTHKKCFKCGDVKPIDDFYTHKRMRDGHLNKCKECTKLDVSMRDPSRVRAYEAKRCQRPERKAYILVAQKRRRASNPEKASAHRELRAAVKSGAIVKPAICQVCLNKTRLVGHHEDYSKPLDVIWMCDPCHKRYHQDPSIKYQIANTPSF